MLVKRIMDGDLPDHGWLEIDGTARDLDVPEGSDDADLRRELDGMLPRVPNVHGRVNVDGIATACQGLPDLVKADIAARLLINSFGITPFPEQDADPGAFAWYVYL